MQASDAQPGDVVFCKEDRTYYQAPGGTGASGWMKMQIIPFFGPPEATAPDGELVLVARNDEPAAG